MPDFPCSGSTATVRIGISACLLGHQVRFDGGHKRDPFLTGTLAPHVEWVPVCPEVELGLPTPRPSLRLVARPGDGRVRLIMPSTNEDFTAEMEAFSVRRLDELAAAELNGFVVKRGSPSCGLERVRVYHPDSGHAPGRSPALRGTGIFTATLRQRWPDLPVEEEGRLSDPRLRENFVERVFAHRRLVDCFRPGWKPADLVAFHTAHKLTLLAHDPRALGELGRLAAQAGSRPATDIESEYRSRFMTALAVVATRRRHANALFHAAGHLKRGLDGAVRQEIAELVQDYRRGFVPLIVPVTLIGHYARRLGVAYLANQTYLNQPPKELMLRNHL